MATTEVLQQRDNVLSSSISSSSSSRQGSGTSHMSRIYKQASSLFLTRRLEEALTTLETLISPTNLETEDADERSDSALVTSSSRGTRIKVWSLYLTLLDAIIDLGPAEGKATFGSTQWKAMVASAQNGTVWDMIIRQGYRGLEGEVDADVVINLATLLLSHASSQRNNQERLERYLSASSTPNLDVANRLRDHNEESSPRKRTRRNDNTGTNTPHDLNSQLKLLELYTLHILPRNNEWEYSREFVNLSEYLDEERREAFLNALQSLQEEKSRAEELAARANMEKERQSEQKRAEARRQAEAIVSEKAQNIAQSESVSQKRSSSEKDYGIESMSPNRTTTRTSSKSVMRKPVKANGGGKNPTPQYSRGEHATGSMTMAERIHLFLAAARKTIMRTGQSLSTDPMALIRTILLLIAIITTLSKRDIRERVRRVAGVGWDKVRSTVGMGVKVSYI